MDFENEKKQDEQQSVEKDGNREGYQREFRPVGRSPRPRIHTGQRPTGYERPNFSKHNQDDDGGFRPEGFGASFIGDQVFKSVDNSFSAITPQELHPQAVAPGFQMYTVWMIRHLDGNPWLQTTRNEDEKYLWLHEAEF